MSSLRSALHEWKSEDLEGRSVAELADDLIEIEKVSGWLESERARRIGAFEAKRGQDLKSSLLRHADEKIVGVRTLIWKGTARLPPFRSIGVKCLEAGPARRWRWPTRYPSFRPPFKPSTAVKFPWTRSG
jgi:hypothetical protein